MFRKVKRSSPALARVKANITQAEEIWRRESGPAAKLSGAVSGDIVQVMLADSGTKWWLVCLTGRENTAGWILRSRLDMIDDGEPLPPPPAIVPGKKDLESWGDVVAQKLSQMPVVSRKASDSVQVTDEKGDEFSNKVESIEKHTTELERDMTSSEIELRLHLIEKMLLNLPRRHKKDKVTRKRSNSVDPCTWSPTRGSIASNLDDDSDDSEHEPRKSVFIIEEESKCPEVGSPEKPARTSMVWVEEEESPLLFADPLLGEKLEKKIKSIKPWERQGFKFREEVGMGALAKKKKDSRHAKLQDVFCLWKIEVYSSKAC